MYWQMFYMDCQYAADLSCIYEHLKAVSTNPLLSKNVGCGSARLVHRSAGVLHRVLTDPRGSGFVSTAEDP
jgi:hypothetical protein